MVAKVAILSTYHRIINPWLPGAADLQLANSYLSITTEKPIEPVGSPTKTAFASITDSIVDTHSAIKVLAITVTAEIGHS